MAKYLPSKLTLNAAENIATTVGDMVTSNTESGITVAFDNADNTLDFTVGTLDQDTTGSAATLTTARNIGGVAFDGSADIDLPGVNAAGSQNTSGTAAIATAVTVSDNESENESNVITFVAGAAGSGNVGLEADGNLTYNPSTGKVTATGFVGALTGAADTVTNATLTTALTVNTGTLTLTANSANNSVLTIGAGAVGISGSNTGDQSASDVLTLIEDGVDSAHYVDGSIDTAHIANDQITADLMADNSVDSDMYVDGSIDTAHIANDQITVDLMADNSIDSDMYVDGSIDTAHFAAGAVDAAAMGADSVDSSELIDGSVDLSHMSVESVDSDQYVDGSIDTAHIADDQVTYAKMQDTGTANRVLGAASAGTIGEVQVVVGMMADNSIDSDQYVDASIDTAHIADDQVTYAKIQNVSATDTVLGRDSANAGVIEEISASNLKAMLGLTNAVVAGAALVSSSLLNAGLILGADANNTINFATSNEIHFQAGGTTGVKVLSDGIIEATALTLGDVTVTSTGTELNALDGITAVVAELNFLDIGTTAVGTAVASKAVILDANKDYTDVRNLTISGELDAATGDFSGIIDVAGAATLASLVCTAAATFGGGYGATGATISTAGVGQFNGALTTDGSLTASSIIIPSDGTIGSADDTDAIAIDDSGLCTFSGDGIDVTGKSTLTARRFPIANGTDGNHTGDVVYLGSTTSMTVGALYHYKSNGSWELADADAVATCDGLLAVALGAASDTNGMLLRGMVTLDHDPGAVGDVLFVSTTAGDVSATAPSGNGDIIRVIGYCLHASNGTIWFNPDSTFVEVTA